MHIGKKIKQFRERLGLTQQALGHIVHVSENAIGNYETGRRNPNVDVLKDIADALKVDLLDFFEEEKKTLLPFPMGYKDFVNWLEGKEDVHGFGWFTSEPFEFEMRSDRYFVELKRDYLVWLKDGFYFVPLKSQWADGDMNDDVIDIEGIRKVLKRDLPDVEREIRKKLLVSHDEKLFAEQVYRSKYDFQLIVNEQWKDFDYLSSAAETHDNILAYIHREKACFVPSREGIVKVPIYEGVWEYFEEEGIDPHHGIYEEEDLSLDEEEKELLNEKQLDKLRLFVANEEYFVKRLLQLLQKEISNQVEEQKLTFTYIEENLDDVEQQAVFHENDHDTIAHFLRYRIGSLDNLKRMLQHSRERRESIFPDEWEAEEVVKTEIVEEKRRTLATKRSEHPKTYQFLLLDDAIFMRTVIDVVPRKPRQLAARMNRHILFKKRAF